MTHAHTHTQLCDLHRTLGKMGGGVWFLYDSEKNFYYEKQNTKY